MMWPARSRWQLFDATERAIVIRSPSTALRAARAGPGEWPVDGGDDECRHQTRMTLSFWFPMYSIWGASRACFHPHGALTTVGVRAGCLTFAPSDAEIRSFAL